MFNTDFVTAKHVHEDNTRRNEQRQATNRVAHERRMAAIARADAEKQSKLARIAGRLGIKGDAQNATDAP
jgi:hypothetical protein